MSSDGWEDCGVSGEAGAVGGWEAGLLHTTGGEHVGMDWDSVAR